MIDDAVLKVKSPIKIIRKEGSKALEEFFDDPDNYRTTKYFETLHELKKIIHEVRNPAHLTEIIESLGNFWTPEKESILELARNNQNIDQPLQETINAMLVGSDKINDATLQKSQECLLNSFTICDTSKQSEKMKEIQNSENFEHLPMLLRKQFKKMLIDTQRSNKNFAE